MKKDKVIPDEAKRLRIVRKNEKFSQKEFALLINKSQSNVVKYENGTIFIPIEVFQFLHEKLGYSYEWLLNGKGEKKVINEKNSLLTDLKEINQKYELLFERYEELNKKLNKIYRDFYSK